jgi:hypothetical protein
LVLLAQQRLGLVRPRALAGPMASRRLHGVCLGLVQAYRPLLTWHRLGVHPPLPRLCQPQQPQQQQQQRRMPTVSERPSPPGAHLQRPQPRQQQQEVDQLGVPPLRQRQQAVWRVLQQQLQASVLRTLLQPGAVGGHQRPPLQAHPQQQQQQPPRRLQQHLVHSPPCPPLPPAPAAPLWVA